MSLCSSMRSSVIWCWFQVEMLSFGSPGSTKSQTRDLNFKLIVLEKYPGVARNLCVASHHPFQFPWSEIEDTMATNHVFLVQRISERLDSLEVQIFQTLRSVQPVEHKVIQVDGRWCSFSMFGWFLGEPAGWFSKGCNLCIGPKIFTGSKIRFPSS